MKFDARINLIIGGMLFILGLNDVLNGDPWWGFFVGLIVFYSIVISWMVIDIQNEKCAKNVRKIVQK